MLSSTVMMFKRSVGSFVTVSFSSWQIATRLSFWSWVNTLGTNFPMHVQLFCENSLTRSITNSNLCTEIVYGTMTILVDSRPYLFHFWGVVAMLGRPDRSSLAVEVLPFLKCPNHSKVRLRLMHQSPEACFNISEFRFTFYPISHRTWYTPFVHQLPPYRRYHKIADGWCNTHTKIRATIKHFHIQPRHSAHSLTRHHHNTL